MAGLDYIPTEVLRNPVYHTIRYCFNTSTSSRDRYSGLIKPIPKLDGKEPSDPFSCMGITVIPIPCKIYADILNIRLSKWIKYNNYLVEEQNGFRCNRSCLEHIYHV